MTRNHSSQSGRERRSRDAESASRYPSGHNTYDDAEYSPSYTIAPSSSSSASTAYRIHEYESMPSSDRRSDRERDREPSRRHRSRVEPSSGHYQSSSHHYSSSGYEHDLIKSLEDAAIRDSDERRSKKKDRDPSRRSKGDAYKSGSTPSSSTHDYHYKEDFILYPPAERSYGEGERAYAPSDGYSRPSYSYGSGDYYAPSKPPKAPKIGRIPTPEFGDVPDGMFSCCDGSSHCSTCGGYRY